MKNLLLLTILIISSLTIYGQQFKGINFGISDSNHIKSLFGNPIESTQDLMLYDQTLGGREVNLLFTLKNGKCNSMVYSPKGDFLTGEDHYSIFKSWNNSLNKKYNLVKDAT